MKLTKAQQTHYETARNFIGWHLLNYGTAPMLADNSVTYGMTIYNIYLRGCLWLTVNDWRNSCKKYADRIEPEELGKILRALKKANPEEFAEYQREHSNA